MKIVGMCVLLGVLALPLLAAGGGASSSAAALLMTRGLVRHINVRDGEVVLKHEPIRNLQMPAMVMAFKLAKPAILSSLRVGDSVRFHAEYGSAGTDDLVITQLEIIH